MSMSKFATKQPDSNEVHLFKGELRVLSQPNEYLYNVELDLLDDRRTANGWRYDNLEMHRALFAGKPILIAYTNGGRKIGDGHNMRSVRGKNGEEYASFTDADSERIIGSLSDNEQDIRLESRDGHTWIVGKGTIWTWYAREAVEKIASQGRMDISIETLVTKNRMNAEEEVEEEYIVLGATILGDDVTPAVKGANIRPLVDEVAFRDLKLRAASYIVAVKEKQEPELPPTIHKGVKRTMSKKLIEKVQGLFPDYRVLSVSEDGNLVALLRNSDNEFRMYNFPETDRETILESRFMDVQASVVMNAAEDMSLSTDVDTLVGDMMTALNSARSELEAEKTARQNAENALAAMKEQQKTQRRQSAKLAAKHELAEINESLAAEERIEEAVLSEVEEDIDKGEYDDCTNAAGEWAGAEKACAAVQSICMKALKANRGKRTRVNAWDAAKSFRDTEDSVLQSIGNLK